MTAEGSGDAVVDASDTDTAKQNYASEYCRCYKSFSQKFTHREQQNVMASTEIGVYVKLVMSTPHTTEKEMLPQRSDWASTNVNNRSSATQGGGF